MGVLSEALGMIDILQAVVTVSLSIILESLVITLSEEHRNRNITVSL
jgi:hypothetical protein